MAWQILGTCAALFVLLCMAISMADAWTGETERLENALGWALLADIIVGFSTVFYLIWNG